VPDLYKYQLYIDGEWVEAQAGDRFPSENPATGKNWAELADGRDTDIDMAVSAARNAFDSGVWAGLLPQQRAAYMRKMADLCVEYGSEIAEYESRDNGKLLSEQRLQWVLISELLHYWAGMADKITGLAIPSPIPIPVKGTHIPESFVYTRKEPIGVVGAITPWNSPAYQTAFKFGPAMAAGCTMVCKPSEYASVSSVKFTELVHKAGFPAGVFNLVTSSRKATGAHLANHKNVDKISFTGSTAVGQEIIKSAAGNLKRVTSELGGKSANIIFADADLERAVAGTMAGIFAAAGQTCMAGSRVLVEESFYDTFVAALAEAAKGLKLGDPLDMSTQIGPISNKPNFDKVVSYLEIGQQEGAKIVAGGRPCEALGGYYVEPTIFRDVHNNMRIAREEIFGPVASIIPFKTEEDAIAIANDSDFGLAGAVFTTDISKAHRVTHKVRAGTMWINNYRVVTHMAPFGGYRMSGWGREGSGEGLEAYLETKAIWVPLE
jgi:aldehyde dehydrogenase (NAD+)